jgi:hypothetical protein
VLALSISVCMETVQHLDKVLIEVAHQVTCRWDMEISWSSRTQWCIRELIDVRCRYEN